jgi:hypothetical protein
MAKQYAAALAERLREQAERFPACQWCGHASLYLLEERPDMNFGALGVVQRTLKCADCEELTIT